MDILIQFMVCFAASVCGILFASWTMDAIRNWKSRRK